MQTPCQPCQPSVNASCLFKLPGTCVFYSGPTVNGPGINTGDLLDVVVSKLINYIGSVTGALPPIEIVSSDFFDSVTYKNSTLDNVPFMLFWNEISRFLISGVDYNPVVGGGFQILIPGFDSTQNSYHFELFPK